ncbi:MAG: thiamine pyrophosphate-dependent enzyme [Planctomycetota bacterium]|nr:thiamine pyrophosphate-dependent enzyme [Planctomycetota bacterium]
MAVSLKELSKKAEGLSSGHRACPGCTAPTAMRMILNAAQAPVVCCFATGCMEVSTTIYPYTSWNVPYIHNCFENSAATMSGVETAYRALKKRGKISDDIRFIAWGGDGGTYDIGLQSLSGALERGHRMLYVCYDNEAYMNTGIQRSGATPRGATTTTAPAGEASFGKQQNKKDLTAIAAAHGIPYAAQAAVHAWRDLMTKVQKALDVNGPSFINVLAPCHRGWRIKPEDGIKISKLAAETCYWPLYEVENGVWKLSFKPSEKKPLDEFLLTQGRFGHLKDPKHAGTRAELQKWVDDRWAALLERTKGTQA